MPSGTKRGRGSLSDSVLDAIDTFYGHAMQPFGGICRGSRPVRVVVRSIGHVEDHLRVLRERAPHSRTGSEFNGPGHRDRPESVRGAEEGDGDNRSCAYEEGGRNDERSVEPNCAGDESASCCAEWSDPVPEEPER